MYSFAGSATPFNGSLELVRSDLVDYLDLSNRASLQLTDSASQLNYKITTSEEEEAAVLHAKMDQDVFTSQFMTPTATLTSETKVTRSSTVTEMLRCPDGLGFAGGSLIRNQSDCKCIHGMEPLGESGLTSGCTKCPRGKHKATVGDVACSSCGGLTTLLEGAISSSSCTCPPRIRQRGC